jgi:hypothetical protein
VISARRADDARLIACAGLVLAAGRTAARPHARIARPQLIARKFDAAAAARNLTARRAGQQDTRPRARPVGFTASRRGFTRGSAPEGISWRTSSYN